MNNSLVARDMKTGAVRWIWTWPTPPAEGRMPYINTETFIRKYMTQGATTSTSAEARGWRGVCRPVLGLLSAWTAAAADTAAADPADIEVRIDWPALLSAASFQLGTPVGWERSPFTGNGRDGMIAEVSPDDGGVLIRLGRSDVVDRRSTGDRSMFFPLWDSGRLPIGRLRILLGERPDPRRRVQSGIDLATAEGYGVCESTNASSGFRWRMWTPMGAAVNVIEVESTAGAMPTVDFLPSPAEIGRTKNKPGGYVPHPEPRVTTQGDIALITQMFTDGGGYTVAWKAATSGKRITILAAIGYDRGGEGHRAEALAALAEAGDLESLRARHRAWWAAWWPRSAIGVPDPARQAFYYQQLYKLGSAMRAGGPMLDLMGPWYGGGPWPGIWWNLNVQLAYQLCAPANRVELLDNLVTFLERNADEMSRRVPAAMGGAHALAIGRISSTDGASLIGDSPEAGNLTWTLGVLWDGYRLTGDRDRALRLLALMARAAAFHVARAKPGPDGRLHLPMGYSPESGAAPDSLYELMPMRWLLRTLVAAETELGWKHPDQGLWKKVLSELTPFPSDANGYMAGAGRPAPLEHRHWSHLIGIYPLRDFDPADAEELEIVRRSVAYWTSDTKMWRGYSAQGASSMWALLGEPEKAFAAGGGTPIGGLNTLYREAGPCIETPLQAAATQQEMLLTWNRRGLRFFAGTPAVWPTASFHLLRAPLGLTVSAHRENGSTQWIRLAASTAQTVTLEGRFAETPELRSAGPVPLTEHGDGWLSVPLAAGQSVLLIAPGAEPRLDLPAPAATPQP
ncbi:MAG: hypothetical protein WD490_07835 [Opitutales bacterium]